MDARREPPGRAGGDARPAWLRSEDRMAVAVAAAFVCIGLETRFADLFGLGRGRPALAFLGGQAANLLWTLLLASLLFGGMPR